MPKNNYIQRLEDERAALTAQVAGLEEGITELRRYLQTEKFWQDPTVQVQDVFARLDDAHNLGTNRRMMQEVSALATRAANPPLFRSATS